MAETPEIHVANGFTPQVFYDTPTGSEICILLLSLQGAEFW